MHVDGSSCELVEQGRFDEGGAVDEQDVDFCAGEEVDGVVGVECFGIDETDLAVGLSCAGLGVVVEEGLLLSGAFVEVHSEGFGGAYVEVFLVGVCGDVACVLVDDGGDVEDVCDGVDEKAVSDVGAGEDADVHGVLLRGWSVSLVCPGVFIGEKWCL